MPPGQATGHQSSLFPNFMQNKYLIFVAIAFLLPVATATAQISPARARRAEQIERAAAERKQADSEAASAGSEFPAKMNVDVQMVLAKRDLKDLPKPNPQPLRGSPTAIRYGSTSGLTGRSAAMLTAFPAKANDIFCSSRSGRKARRPQKTTTLCVSRKTT